MSRGKRETVASVRCTDSQRLVPSSRPGELVARSDTRLLVKRSTQESHRLFSSATRMGWQGPLEAARRQALHENLFVLPPPLAERRVHLQTGRCCRAVKLKVVRKVKGFALQHCIRRCLHLRGVAEAKADAAGPQSSVRGPVNLGSSTATTCYLSQREITRLQLRVRLPKSIPYIPPILRDEVRSIPIYMPILRELAGKLLLPPPPRVPPQIPNPIPRPHDRARCM